MNIGNDQIIPAHKKFDHTDLFWLGYLIFFLIEPIARGTATYWIESLAVMALFIVVYLSFLRFSNFRLRLGLIAFMFGMGVVCYPWNLGSPAFMIYAAALIPFMLISLPWTLAALALDAAALCFEGLHFHTSPYSWGINAVMIFAAGGGNIIFAQKQRADCKLRMKQDEIETLAAVAERERIARDLHDVLGHTLSVIVLKSELAGRLLDRELAGGWIDRELAPLALTNGSHFTAPTELSSRPQQDSLTVLRSGETCGSEPPPEPIRSQHFSTLTRARNEMADVERTARTALSEVREAIGGYRARGLDAEIEAARGTLRSAGVTLVTEGALKPANLSAAEETVLALALREAVTNIVRHAQATECRLRLVVENGRQRLSIEDNGEHASAREGNGLRGMRERVESLGGQLSLTREAGTHLLIELPLRAGAPS